MYRLTRAYRGIVIDAGHGGNDPGASGNGIIEKELTLDRAFTKVPGLNSPSMLVATPLLAIKLAIDVTKQPDSAIVVLLGDNGIEPHFSSYCFQLR